MTPNTPYNDGSLRQRGERYGCGCIVGIYSCYDSLLMCGANPRNQAKIRAHKAEIRFGPRSEQLDLGAYHARYDDGEPAGCSCHISPPCDWCINHCPDCGDRVADCECGTCQ